MTGQDDQDLEAAVVDHGGKPRGSEVTNSSVAGTLDGKSNEKERLACQEDIVCVSAKKPSVSNCLRIIQSDKELLKLEGNAITRFRGQKERLVQQGAGKGMEEDQEPSLSNCLRIIQRNEIRLPGAHAIQQYDPSRTGQYSIRHERQRVAEPPPIHGAVVVAPEGEEKMDISIDNQREQGGGGEVLDAKVLTPAPPSQNGVSESQTAWLVIFAFFVLGLGLLVLLGLLLPSSGSDSTGTNSEPHKYPPFRIGLPAATVKAIQEDEDHPFSKANAWMWSDPQLRSYSIDRQWQRFHLVAFYYFAGGDQWHRKDDWLSYDTQECDWFSQHYNDSIVQYDSYAPCDGESHLIKLSLNSNNLQGPSPDFRNLFPFLQTLDVGNNLMHGPPPDAFVSTLEVYVIANNRFEGQFLGNNRFDSTNLRVVQMQNNQLYGHNYGPNFALLSNLERMDLSNNHFDEILTSNLGQCKKLTHLLGGGNRFRGTIPTEVGLITNLRQMDFSHNTKVHGPIPSELGMLTALELCNASGTAIRGPVPDAWCERIRKGQLVFEANCTLVDCCQ